MCSAWLFRQNFHRRHIYSLCVYSNLKFQFFSATFFGARTEKEVAEICSAIVFMRTIQRTFLPQERERDAHLQNLCAHIVHNDR